MSSITLFAFQKAVFATRTVSCFWDFLFWKCFQCGLGETCPSLLYCLVHARQLFRHLPVFFSRLRNRNTIDSDDAIYGKNHYVSVGQQGRRKQGRISRKRRRGAAICMGWECKDTQWMDRGKEQTRCRFKSSSPLASPVDLEKGK